MPTIYCPPEWAPQSGVMLTWPHAQSDWRDHLDLVEPVFVELVQQISLHQKLLISCWNDAHLAAVKIRLTLADVDMNNVLLYAVPSNDTWVRDHGPITVLVDGVPHLLSFTFNGWGHKFDAALDNQLTQQLHTLGSFGDTPLQTIHFVLEGGGIDVDGAGTLLTTRRCLMAPTRNPHLNQQQIEATLNELLGVDRFLWLDHGYLAGDDTDSHIDTLARFCDAGTITYVACDDPEDEHYTELKAMENELKVFRTRDGQPYTLIPLPWPKAKYDDDGHRLPATYANFLILNNVVLVPTYADWADKAALVQIKKCFPEREIIAVSCQPLILQHGSLHCVTMQLPAGVLHE